MSATDYVRLRDRGQITIKEEVREALGLQEGDLLKLVIEKVKEEIKE